MEWSMPRPYVTGQSPSQGDQTTSDTWECLGVNAGMFLRIRSDINDHIFELWRQMLRRLIIAVIYSA